MHHYIHHLPRSSKLPLQFLLYVSTKSCHSISSHHPTPPPTNNLAGFLQGHIPKPHLRQIHAHIYRIDAHQDNLVATRLIGHYPPSSALKVFHSLQNPNIFPFNAIIRVLAEQGLATSAFIVFKKLKCSTPLYPNDLTFSFLLKACSSERVDVCYVEQVHTQVVKTGFVRDPFVRSGLLMVYAKWVRDLGSARKVFDEMPERNLVSCWTSLICGYARAASAEEALKLFIVMLKENQLPESDTMVSVLSACSRLKATHIEKWASVLTGCLKDLQGCSLGGDYVNTILVYLYGKCGNLEKSREAFDQISDKGKRSVLCWNSVIGAYVQNGCALEALALFKSMMENYDCRPNHVTMVNVLSACSEIGDLDLGMWVHEYMRNRGPKGVLSSNVNLATALIDMYSKCGSLDEARKVFDLVDVKDVVSFNAMIIGLAVNGKGDEALKLFSKMQGSTLRPDSGTYLGALCACSHSGLLDQGRDIFDEMKRQNTVVIKLEHYASYVDLLARSGLIEEALDVVASMPFEPNNFVWGALLSGCVLHNRLELAHSISAMLVTVDPDNSAGYVMLSNSFAADHEWRDVLDLRGVMREKGVTKQPGHSWINIDGVVHEFVAGSALYLQIGGIHQIMESLLKQMRLSCL